MPLVLPGLILWLVLCLALFVLPRPSLRAAGWFLRRIGWIPAGRPPRPIGWVPTLVTMGSAFCLACAGIVAAVFIAIFLIWDIHLSEMQARKALPVTHSTPQMPEIAFQPLDEPLRERIVSRIQPLIETGKHVGIVAVVVRGEQAAVFGFGERQLGEANTPDGDTVFEIGSVTKVFTALAFSRLVQEGKVPLECPVQELLPPGATVPEKDGRRITTLDLATQSSGLPRLPDNAKSAWSVLTLQALRNPYASYKPEDAYEFLQRHQLRRVPGSEYEYSNFGMGLLGLALSLRQQANYEAMVTSLVCQPLGLKDTRLTFPRGTQIRRARAYFMLRAEGSTVTGFACDPWDFGDATAGAGALRSTGNDMLRFLAANLGLFETTLWSVLEDAQKPRRKADEGMSIGLGCHLFDKMDPVEGPVIWHNGQTGGCHAFVGFAPARRIGVAMLGNTAADLDGEALEVLKVLAANNP